ncbi:MAG: hypothetical protein ACRDZ8_02860 [Acidimicrobiales bacterium]
MSIYSSGGDALRDTAKWLVSLVPVAGVVATGAVLVPRLVAAGAATNSGLSWLDAYKWPLVGLVAVVTGIGATVWWGATVLSTEPASFTAVLSNASTLSTAFSAGVGAPYFLDSEQFGQTWALVAARVSAGDPVEATTLTATLGAADALRDWAYEQAVRAAFDRFKVAFSAGLVLIVAGFLTVAVTVPVPPATVGEPRAVRVVMPAAAPRAAAAGADLHHATGCTAAATTTFVAVGGTWATPVLQVDGPGCRFDARWHPKVDDVHLVPLGD